MLDIFFKESREKNLVEAIEKKNYKGVEKVLSKNIDVNFRCTKGGTPLIHSLLFPNKKIFLLLLKKGANINYTTKNGYSPLITASIQNNYSLINFLLDRGAKVNQKTLEGWSAILYASGNITYTYDIISSELNRTIIQYFNTQKNYHLEFNPTDCVDALLRKGANPNDHNVVGTTPLMNAAQIENFSSVELLLNSRADKKKLDQNKKNAVMYAVGSDIKTFYQSIASLSPINVEINLYKSEEELQNDFLPYFMDNQYQTTKILVESGCKLDNKDKNGISTLMYAAHSGNLSLISYLANTGINLKEATPEGFTPLHFSAMNGKTNLVDFFLHNGYDIDQKTRDGETPLMTAVWMGHVDTVYYLINNGANIDARKKTVQNPQGETASQWAAHKLRTEKDPRYFKILKKLDEENEKNREMMSNYLNN